MSTTLVLTDAPVATMQQLTSLLDANGLSPRDPVAVATASGALAAGALSAAAYDTVLSVAARPGHHTVQLLGLVAAALKPGGKLVVQEVSRGAWNGPCYAETFNRLMCLFPRCQTLICDDPMPDTGCSLPVAWHKRGRIA
jgi:hypothetical protein